MASVAGRRAVLILACLLPAGGGVALPQLPEGFAAAYRGARVIAILPPLSIVREHAAGDAVRPDWSAAGYGNVAEALEAALEARGLQVVWIHPVPEAERFIEGLTESILVTLGESVWGDSVPTGYRLSPADRRFLEHERRYRQEVLALLLRAVGADLLLVARAEGLVQSAEKASSERLSRFLGAILFGDPGPEVASTWSDVYVYIVEPGGKVIYAGAGGQASTLMDAKGAAAIVERALGELPRPSHDKAFGATCVLSSECQPGLYCPYGRCIRGEEPSPGR